MATTLDEQITQLKNAIAELEAQRSILGDEAVEAALVPSRKKLAALEAQAGTAEQKSPQIPTRLRKLVTLLYMDVVGSTAMTQHLDPEDTLEIMDNALPRLALPIQAHGGHVTRYTGDGFKAVFGDPLARENDPEQAILAGLEILDISHRHGIGSLGWANRGRRYSNGKGCEPCGTHRERSTTWWLTHLPQHLPPRARRVQSRTARTDRSQGVSRTRSRLFG
jgi:hypothetical protein